MRLARPHAAAWPHRFTLACRFLNPNPSQSPTQRRGLSCPRAQRAFLFLFLLGLVSGTSAERRQRPHPGGRRSGGAQLLVFFFFSSFPVIERARHTWFPASVALAVSDGVMQYQRAHAIAGPARAPHDPVMLRTWSACGERARARAHLQALERCARSHAQRGQVAARSFGARPSIHRSYVPVRVKAIGWPAHALHALKIEAGLVAAVQCHGACTDRIAD